jgi:hypothetical protein
VDIVSNSRTDVATQVTSVTTQTEDAINTWNNLRIAYVLNVDAGIGGSNVQTTLLNAQGAAGADGSVVILNGALNYVDGLTLDDRQTLLGGGTALRLRGAMAGIELDYVASGVAGSLTGRGTEVANFYGLVNLGNSSVVGGLTLTQFSAAGMNAVIQTHSNNAVAFGNTVYGADLIYSHGIVFDNADDGVAFGNTITTGPANNSFGLVARNGSQRARFEANHVCTNSFDGAPVLAISSASATVMGNTFRANGISFVAMASLQGTYLGGSIGNIIDGPYLHKCSGFTGGSGTVEFTDGTACSGP